MGHHQKIVLKCKTPQKIFYQSLYYSGYVLKTKHFVIYGPNQCLGNVTDAIKYDLQNYAFKKNLLVSHCTVTDQTK